MRADKRLGRKDDGVSHAVISRIKQCFVMRHIVLLKKIEQRVALGDRNDAVARRVSNKWKHLILLKDGCVPSEVRAYWLM